MPKAEAELMPKSQSERGRVTKKEIKNVNKMLSTE